MHRTFRTPLLPALSGASRTRLYSSTTKTTQTHAADVENKRSQNRKSLQMQSPAAALNTQMKNELTKIQKQVSLNADMKGMQTLEAIHEMMDVYRRYRDSQASKQDTKVNASDPIHSILTILRLRTKILKPVISKVRKQIMGTQNEVLCRYLTEIADDLVAGRSYATHFALAYMITAFNTMENDVQASLVWKRLENESQISQDLASRLADPRVVAAVIRSGDPGVVSIGELEEMHRRTTEKNGRYMLLDEALALSYVKFGNYGKAVELFASICEHYDIGEWMTSILRLHNQILTQTTDMEIATTFFETGTAPDTFVQLHPSAVARYVEHLYEATGNPEAVVDVYERASKKIPTQTVPNYRFGTAQCLNMTAEVMKALNKHFGLTGPTEELRALVTRVIAANPDQLCINTVLSYVFKAWEGSSYIADLQSQYFMGANLDFDALRVVLSSCQSLNTSQVSLDRIISWWEQLLALKSPQVFDWISLARACDNPDRLDYFIDQWTHHDNSRMHIKFEFAPTVYAGLVARGLVAGTPNFGGQFSADLVNSEVKAHEKEAVHA